MGKSTLAEIIFVILCILGFANLKKPQNYG